MHDLTFILHYKGTYEKVVSMVIFTKNLYMSPPKKGWYRVALEKGNTTFYSELSFWIVN